ncbi:MAG TPA: 4'-phosphopantetheinyl transferase superfamily protein [Flavobacteriaceae bacterium]|nr:4'-phosphopantetheinyl transferase superfamily protein [Flavobacteriaceae bacterium]
MPIYKTITHNSQTSVKIWKITESYNDLLKPLDLKSESLERVLGMRSELHQKGFLSIRHLLRAFGYTDEDLFYDDNGKPHLEDGKFISITHSFTFSAVVVSDNLVGIDIEKQRKKIEVIAHKFVDYEFDYLNEKDENYVNDLTKIWCIKESLYKLFATNGLSFKEHCLVIPFSNQDETTMAWIDYRNKKFRFCAHFFDFDGFTCAYTLPS